MLRTILLFSGFLILFFQQYIQPVSATLQFIIFLTGIILLGVPHGAADLLVATQNAEDEKKSFSKIKFFVNYLGRLILFAAILWFFPLMGNLLFILFAAYHFGETDLYLFNTNNAAGKLFVISYGLVILGVILLNHIEEMKPLIESFDYSGKYMFLINWLDKYRYPVLSFLGVFFFAATFIFFSTKNSGLQSQGQFLIQFGIILFILFNLPMILGFTFYFIVWHSVLSLRNIVTYLRKDGLLPIAIIAKQISIYSVIAMMGIFLFGLTGFMVVSNNAAMVYIFLGLAVLTAPHMQIMHNMYKNVRSNKTGIKIL
jgi:beta-carotene 15,15'-dioxygenase